MDEPTSEPSSTISDASYGDLDEIQVEGGIITRFISSLSWWQRQFLALLLGQLLSLCLTCTGITSESLATFYSVDIPTTQSFLNYFLLFLIYNAVALRDHRSYIISVKERWWIMIILALIDVEANYVIVSAYQYTSITSAMLLDCFTIPCVMLLSFFILRERFHWFHLLAVVICIIGLAILIFSDAIQSQNEEGSQFISWISPLILTIIKLGSREILGDCLVLLSSVLYACSNVGQQYQVERYSNVHFLAMLGMFGCAISFLQMMVLELSTLRSITWEWEIVGLIVLFGLSMFALYSTTPFLLQLSSATLMNISFLTADAYSLILGIYIFHYQLSVLYFISLFVIVSGLLLYNIKASTKSQEAEQIKGEFTRQYMHSSSLNSQSEGDTDGFGVETPQRARFSSFGSLFSTGGESDISITH